MAEQEWPLLTGEARDYLQAYADGVNAYATDLQAGKYDIDPAVMVSFDPARFAPRRI